MDWTWVQSPCASLRHMQGKLEHETALNDYEAWWEREGKDISAAHDRAGTPWLRMFDVYGKRIDEVQCAPEYWTMLRKGYKTGAVWRAFKEQSLKSSFRIGYICCFYDPGLFCPYTVSLSTLLPLSKYGAEEIKARFIPQLLREDDTVWQGATWLTEAGGGSDLGSYVDTVARRDGDRWLLSGDKYFTSNAIADVAVVAARPARQQAAGPQLISCQRRERRTQLRYSPHQGQIAAPVFRRDRTPRQRRLSARQSRARDLPYPRSAQLFPRVQRRRQRRLRSARSRTP